MPASARNPAAILVIRTWAVVSLENVAIEGEGMVQYRFALPLRYLPWFMHNRVPVVFNNMF